jgi:hypothetical protein
MAYKRVDPLEFVSLKRAAEIIGVDHQRLWWLVRDGRVSAPTHPHGMKRYYKPDELKEVRRQFEQSTPKVTK